MRVAVIGMGLMGSLHARIYRDMQGVDLVATVERDPVRRDAAAREHGLPCHASLTEDLLDRVDAVSVTLPDHLHVDACVAALNSGVDVLVEKPLAATVSMAQDILDAEDKLQAGRVMVGQLLRFDSRLRRMREILTSGQLGDLRYLRIHRANTVSTGERLGGVVPVTSFLGVHDLDLLLWLSDRSIVDVSARGTSVFGNVWDLSVAYLTLTGGVQALVENHWLIHDLSAQSCYAGVQAFGSEGTCVVDLSTDELSLTTSESARTRWIDSRNWTHDQNVSGGSLRAELAAFVNAVVTKEPMPITSHDGMRAVRAVEVVERALARPGVVISAD